MSQSQEQLTSWQASIPTSHLPSSTPLLFSQKSHLLRVFWWSSRVLSVIPDVWITDFFTSTSSEQAPLVFQCHAACAIPMKAPNVVFVPSLEALSVLVSEVVKKERGRDDYDFHFSLPYGCWNDKNINKWKWGNKDFLTQFSCAHFFILEFGVQLTAKTPI